MSFIKSFKPFDLLYLYKRVKYKFSALKYACTKCTMAYETFEIHRRKRKA